MTAPDTAGRLYVVATPIGNLADLSGRGARVLSEVELIAAEDTRTARKLLTHHGIRTRLVSYHRHNEDVRTPELLERLTAGDDVAVVSEAGTPSISDPGQHLVNAAIERGFEVVPVPGPSSVLAALVVSGLDTSTFAFEGFLPRKAAERRRHLESLGAEHRTLVFFESPHRLDATVADIGAVLGDRRVALCRELTKVHEEVRRGTAAEIAESLATHPAKGEIVLVVEGAAPSAPDLDAAFTEACDAVDAGTSVSDAARQVAARHGVSRRHLYDLLLDHTRTDAE